MHFSSEEIKVIVLPVANESWVKMPRLIAMDSDSKRVLEVLRLTDDLKVEGADLYLRAGIVGN